MVFIYTLKLQNNKYYIGKTNSPDFRIESHFQSIGSVWTKLHKPIEVLEIIPNCDDYDEDKYTLMYMEKYGIENVRGGSFVQIKLSEEEIKVITQMITGTTNKCFKCGKAGHFAKDCINVCICNYCHGSFKTNASLEAHEKCCYKNTNLSMMSWMFNVVKKTIIGNKEDDDKEDDDKEDDDKEDVETIEEIKEDVEIEEKCDRCGRVGHLEDKCYAKTHLDGKTLEVKEKKAKKILKCYKCGRYGHLEDKCYAKMHIKGYTISKVEDDAKTNAITKMLME